MLLASLSTQGHRKVKDPRFEQQDRKEPRGEDNASISEQKEQPGVGQTGYSALKLHPGTLPLPVYDIPHCFTEIQVNLLSPKPPPPQSQACTRADLCMCSKSECTLYFPGLSSVFSTDTMTQKRQSPPAKPCKEGGFK